MLPPQKLLPSSLFLLSLLACSGKDEEAAYDGEESAAAGNCGDGADNDYDGLFDCDDDGCADAPECSDDTGGSGGSGGSGSGGSGSGGSGDSGSGGSGSGGSGDSGGENQPPVADAGADQLACPNDYVNLNGTGSYDPDGTIVSYDWDPTNSGATPSIRASSNEGSTLLYELVVTDDEGATSAPDETRIISNTLPVYRSASARGDCSYSRDLEDDWPWFLWDDECDSRECSCTLTFNIDDPDGNEQLDWEGLPDEGPDPTVSGNSITVYTGSWCINDGGVLQYTDPCGEPLGDFDTPEVRFSLSCP